MAKNDEFAFQLSEQDEQCLRAIMADNKITPSRPLNLDLLGYSLLAVALACGLFFLKDSVWLASWAGDFAASIRNAWGSASLPNWLCEP
ncbi:hypothetical protein [Methylomonas sp. HYX-M1]|uniref:hypothetical protein n=1 Tax=Methylomonas sp. HYX-M1 TaxID=3139307 RepID=UPI00345BEC3D